MVGTIYRYTYVPPGCRTLQYRMRFIPLSVSLWKWQALRAGLMLHYWAELPVPFGIYCFPFLLFLPVGWYCGAGVFGLIGCQSLSPGLVFLSFFNSNRNSNVYEFK